MKVLITGGYGFIGSFVAERFYKEGYNVYILDNLSTGKPENVGCKHKFYKMNVEEQKCNEVFQSNRFDVVVHLAAQIDVAASMNDPFRDSMTNVIGLVNMLRLSSKYGVSRFIFTSSAAVYGLNERTPLHEETPCDPVSVYGINKLFGEVYCKKWTEMYGLSTLCFRLSNVYGPKQGARGEGGVISQFMHRMNHDEEIVLHGDGNQVRDFIYVEDVADAIYRSVAIDYTGVLNLSTMTENSINDLIDMMQREKKFKRITHEPKRAGDIEKSVLDNALAKKKLDWVPMYSLSEGLTKTAAWFAEQKSDQKNEDQEKAEGIFRWRSWEFMPYIENLLAFLVVLGISLSSFSSSAFDLRLIYIVLIGAVYGTRQSILAVILSCGLFIWESLQNGREIVSLLYDANSLFHVAVYLIIGVAVGYSVEKRNRDVASNEMQKQAVEDKYSFLQEIYNDLLVVKSELQQQIVNSGDSFGKMYSITKELDSLEPEKVFQSSIKVLERIMKSDAISIYTTNQNGTFLRLMAKSNKSGFDLPRSLRVADHAYLEQIRYTQKMFVNKELNPDAPLMAAPIFDGGRMVAVVSVQTLGFEHFTLYSQNLFQVAVQLITSALSRSLQFLASTQKERYVGDTTILKSRYFYEALKNKQEAKRQLNIDFSLLSVERGELDNQTLSAHIAGSLREADYLGTDETEELYIILSNSNEQEARIVINRLAKLDIKAELVTENVGSLLMAKDEVYA